MDAFLIMLRNVLLFVALAIPGYILVKTGMLKQEQSGVISKLLMYIGMPFFILSSTMTSFAFNKEFLLLISIVILTGTLYTIYMSFVSKPLTAMEKNEKTRGVMRFSAVFANNGFLGIPLAAAVFGDSSPVLTLIIVLNIINNILIFTLGVYHISGDKNAIRLKNAFLNPVLIAFIVGIILKFFHVNESIPEVLSFANHFKGLVTPLSMVVLGMKLGAINIRSLFTSARLYYTAFLRLVLYPVAIVAVLLVARPLIPAFINETLILAFFVAFAMPTAGLASTLADRYNGDTENAATMTLSTTILSVLTIPLLYWLLCLCL